MIVAQAVLSEEVALVSLTARRYILTGGVVLAAASAALGVAVMFLTRRHGGVAILAPMLLLPSLMLSLRQVQRVERGQEAEDSGTARLRGWVTPLFTVAVVVALVVLETDYWTSAMGA